MLSLSEAYNKSVQEESSLTAEQLKTRHVGKQGECAVEVETQSFGPCFPQRREIGLLRSHPITLPFSLSHLRVPGCVETDPKRHLEDAVEQAMGDSILQSLNAMLLAEL